MSALQIDLETADFVLVNNNLVLIDGPQETQQLITQNLWAWQGEWFLNLLEGIPYLQKIFIKNPTEAESILKAAILGTPNVSQITAFNFQENPQTRVAGLTFKADTPNGPVGGQVLFPPTPPGMAA